MLSKQYLKLMGSNSISYNILTSGDTVDALKTFFPSSAGKDREVMIFRRWL